MKNKAKIFIYGFNAAQAGQALILVLIFFLLGSLILTPTLMHMGTALKTESKYEDIAGEFLTADAGIETGLWRIKYDFMGPSYDPYDFDTVWPYETGEINGLSADVLVQNVWLPGNVTLEDLSLDAAEAREIIESEKLVISGTSGAVPGQPFHIKMEFTPADGDNLTIKSIGVWLPQGFTYTAGNSELEQLSAFDPCHSDDVDIDNVPGGQTIVWSYNPPYPLFISFPNFTVEEETMSVTFSFTYNRTTEDPDKMPLGVAWVLTDMDPTCINPNDVPISWDTDMRYYKITSASGKTNIEAYSSKSQLRNLEGAIAGDCVAVGNSLMINPVSNIYQTWLPSSDYTLTAIPADADVLYAYLYWSGFRNTTNTIWSDTCTDFSNWDRETETRIPTADGDVTGIWNTASFWEDVDETVPNDADYLTGVTSPGGITFTFTPFSIPAGYFINDLTIYIRAKDANTGTNHIMADIKVRDVHYQTSYSNPDSSFNTYSFQYSTNPYTGSPWTVDDINGTGASPLQQFGIYSDDLNPDIEVSMVYAEVNLSRWTIHDDDEFQGQGTSDTSIIPRTLTLKNAINLSSYAPGTVAFAWIQYDYETDGSLETDDALYYAFSGDNGITWGPDIEAFHDDISSQTHYAIVPEEYMGVTTKIRFYYNFGDENEYVRLDNIRVYYMPPDTSITFSINDQQVYLDSEGNPQAGSQPLTVSSGSIIINETWGGYSYACKRDVSKLVKKYPVVPGEQHHTGNAKYTVGDVQADTGQHVSYAGWSLIIIYSSPQTAGHYLYLYDVFSFNPQNTNLDFDYDGEPGGDITGFKFPEPIRNKQGQILETTAARLTVFVGEGDAWLYGTVPNTDCVRATGQQSQAAKYLNNTASPNNNVWNSASYPCETLVGVDIDTFEILWSDNILTPNDTKLTLDMYSGQDAWNLIYFILSVRSETVTSGTEHYTIGVQ